MNTKRRAEAMACEWGLAWGYEPDTQLWRVGEAINLRLLGCILGPLAVLDFIAREKGEPL